MVAIFNIMVSICLWTLTLGFFGFLTGFSLYCIKIGIDGNEKITIALGVMLLLMTNMMAWGMLAAFIGG